MSNPNSAVIENSESFERRNFPKLKGGGTELVSRSPAVLRPTSSLTMNLG